MIDLMHSPGKLAHAVDWRFVEEKLGAVYQYGSGPTAVADAADGRPCGSQAHAQRQRRMCELWLENSHFGREAARISGTLSPASFAALTGLWAR